MRRSDDPPIPLMEVQLSSRKGKYWGARHICVCSYSDEYGDLCFHCAHGIAWVCFDRLGSKAADAGERDVSDEEFVPCGCHYSLDFDKREDFG